jgi:hypothetical protein
MHRGDKQPKSSPSGVIDIDFARQFRALRSDHSLRLNDYQAQKPSDERPQWSATPHSALHLAPGTQRRRLEQVLSTHRAGRGGLWRL